MAHVKLIVACVLVAVFVQTDALLGFRDSKSFLFREPPVDEDTVKSIDVTEHWITQKLDNFDPTDTRTFQMVITQCECGMEKDYLFYFHSDICKINVISKAEDQFSSWLVANGKFLRKQFRLANMSSIWQKSSMHCYCTVNIDIMAELGQQSMLQLLAVGSWQLFVPEIKLFYFLFKLNVDGRPALFVR